MKNKFNFEGKLDFNDIDLTSPKEVVDEVIKNLSESTSGIIGGKVEEYSGPIHSYTDGGFNAIKVALGTASRHVDIQEKLGKTSEESEKYEFYLQTPLYEHYKFRVCFIKFGVSNYPVEIVLEQGIVDELYGEDEDYIIHCNNKDEFEELLFDIINSESVIRIMQELIRINQIHREEAIKNQEEINRAIEENANRPIEGAALE